MEGWRESEGREEEKHQEGEKETKQFIKKKQDNALQSMRSSCSSACLGEYGAVASVPQETMVPFLLV